MFGKAGNGSYRHWTYSGTNNTGMIAVGSISNYSAASMKGLLDKAAIGDILQFDEPNIHTMIVYGVDSDGVWIYDCNADNNCGIRFEKKDFGTWNGRNSARLTLLRADNYDPYVNIGDDFYAYIGHQSSYKWITHKNNNVCVDTAAGSDSQIWHFIRRENGSYSILNTEGYAMDVSGAGNTPGTNLQMMPYVDNAAQRFFIYYQYGAFYFKCSYANIWIDVDTSSYNVAFGSQYADYAPQEFNIQKIDYNGHIPVDLGSDFYSPIKNLYSEKYVMYSGSNVCVTADANQKQLWHFVRHADRSYSMLTEKSYAIDVAGANNAAGTNLQIVPYADNFAQRFYIYRINDAYYFKCYYADIWFDMDHTNDNMLLWVFESDKTQQFAVMKDHIWDNGIVSLIPTCESAGERVFTCIDCGETKSEPIPATGHAWGEWTKLNGKQHQRVCANDASHVETAPHEWNKGKVTKKATCEEDGVKTYTCTVCKATKTEPIPATGHAFGAWEKLDDEQHRRVCANDESHVETAAHTWNKGKVTTKATCEEDGVKTYTCTACKAAKTEVIPATGHAFGEWTELDENEHRRVCANDPSHVETAAHNWTEGRVVREPAPGVEGEKQYVCKDCYAVKAEPIEALPTEARTTDEPTTQAPATDEPTTEAPATDEPTTEAPATDEPTTQAPATDEPTTETPATEEPTTEAPVTDEPTTQATATDEPTTEAPATEEPTTEAPANEPTTAEPAKYFTLGDVNMDGSVNAKDARLALRAAAKVESLSELQMILADVSEDGRVKAADARAILRIAARLEPKPVKQIPAA